MAAEVRDDELVLRPQKLIDKSQAWFWTEGWQAAERQAEDDIRSGRDHEFADAEKAIAYLHQRAGNAAEE